MAFDRPHKTAAARHADAVPARPSVRFDISLISSLLRPASGYAAYAGIGSRETPVDILADMRRIGEALAARGFTLRSGGADGADLAFEEISPGVIAPKGNRPREIYVPWKGFNLPPAKKAFDDRLFPGNSSADRSITARAQDIAARAHPAWQHCSPGAKSLHTRNVHQVLGMKLDSPVRFIIAWTKDGGPTGGTGQAIRIANDLEIPVLNLFDRSVRAEILKVLELSV